MSDVSSSSPQYRVAGRMSKQDLTKIDQAGEFAARITELFSRIKPKKIIETGTYFATGTTTVIARALRELNLDDATFFSIEINPKHYSRALAHITKENLNVKLLNGLSVPRALLPSRDQIDQLYVKSVQADQLIVDHEPEARAELYYRETDYPHLPDDLLGQALREFGNRADFVLLDSGGHMGYVEFKYVISELRKSCWIALDDIRHVKHFQSFADMQNDPRFEIDAVSDEKFGFCIARFSPQPKSKRRESAA